MRTKPDLDQVLETVELRLGVRQVSAEDRILEDLGAESADIVNLISSLEARYEVHIPEERIPELRTVSDLHAELVRLVSQSDSRGV